MSNLNVGPSKRHRTMSKAMKRSLGLDSDSSADDTADNQPTASDTDRPSTPAATTDSSSSLARPRAAAPPLARSASTTSLGANSDSNSHTVLSKDAKTRAEFAKRFSTATTSDSDVLGEVFWHCIYAYAKYYIYLEHQMKSWKSEVYAHFQMPPSIVHAVDGTVQYKYSCKRSVNLLDA